MYLQIGSYRHRVAEADVRISRQPLDTNALGQIITVRDRWEISGKIHNRTGTASGIEPLLLAFEQAYSRDGQDLILRYTGGGASYHQLLNRDCIGGTRIVSPPSFPEARRGEYVSYRTYAVAVEGIRPLAQARNLFTEFSETISIRGGGARWGVQEVNFGPGVRQQLRTHTKCVATQSGSATLYVGRPSVPPPIWPFALVDQFPDLDKVNPQSISSGNANAIVNRSINWSYNYEFPFRLDGEPHYLIG